MAVSEDFFCKVVFSSKQSLNIESFIGKDSRLKINHSTFLALISRCQSYGLNPLTDYYRYAFVLVSPFYILKKRINSRVFRHQTLAFIVADVLKPLPAIVVSWLSPVFDEVIPLAVQYNESDFDFLIRVLAIKRCVSFFSLGGVFCLTIVGAQHLGIKSRKNSVYYHPITTIPVEGKSILAIQEIAKGDEVRFLATSFCSDFFLNDVLHLQSHPIKSFNQSYVVVGISVDYDQSDVPLCYELQLVPQGHVFCCRPKTKKTNVLLPAQVVSSSASSDVAVNSDGSYYIRYAFDGPFNNCNTQKVFRLHPFGGDDKKGGGIHFPLAAKTWVLVQLVDGDFNQPVIVGALHGAMNKTPLVKKNHRTHLLQSKAGHSLLMNEKNNSLNIVLSTNDKSAFLQADSLKKGPVFLQSCLHGQVSFSAQQDVTRHQESSRWQAKEIIIKSSHDCVMSSRAGSIKSSAKKTQVFSSQQNIVIQSQQGSVYFKVQQTQKTKTKKTLYWQAEGNNARVLLQGGVISWHSQQGVQCKGQAINFTAGAASINLNQAGFCINASVFNLNAPVINVYGLTKP